MTADFNILWQPWQWKTPHGFYLKGQYLQLDDQKLSHIPLYKRPVIHFVHGNSYAGRVYDPVWQLVYPWVDIFLHDVQGHGESESGEETGLRFLGWETSASYLKQAWLAQQTNWQNRTVIGGGHSFGGVLTAAAAVEDPNLYHQLLLLDPIILPPRWCFWVDVFSKLGLYQKNSMAKKAAQRRANWASPAEAYLSLKERGMFKGWQPEALMAYVKHGMESREDGVVLRCPPQIEAEIFGSYMPKLWSRLYQLQTPAQFVFGQTSYPFLKRTQTALRKQAAIRLTQVKGGHCFMLQYPEPAAQLFIQTIKKAL